ncbi:glycosyltransferase family 4 protein [Baekduia alba]|uniref:glycosyltransferase family 4 protein n=1 Tax=Baekduia alba TaxID=2997333 RepID=UPI002341622A|nr:glycosyltransferase family 4 protein [Baekduia alba]
MDVAIVAPCPVPFQLGGAENLWRALQDHLNEQTGHQAALVSIPSREHGFWELLDSYRRFAELDLAGFDVVISGKYPAWMVEHPAHVVYMLHPLRGLYDTYHFFGLPDAVPDPPAEVAALLQFLTDHAGEGSALPELWERLAALHARADALPAELFAFPGPLIRTLVRWLDGVAFAPGRVGRFGAISHTVAGRANYFPEGEDVFVVHPPTVARATPPARRLTDFGRRGSYLFTVSRLDDAKRVGLLVEAMSHVRADVALRIAGAGPMLEPLREQAAGDPRITLLGRVSDEELARLYTGAQAVAFVPYDEDFGLVALEAMEFERPVITVSDAGGPMELVEDGVSGLVAAPDAAALAGAIERLMGDPRAARRMGRAGAERARRVSWDALVAELEAVGERSLAA